VSAYQSWLRCSSNRCMAFAGIFSLDRLGDRGKRLFARGNRHSWPPQRPPRLTRGLQWTRVSSRRTRVRPAQELAEWQRLRARGDWDYHVSPSTNRASILRHGLDITWMSGIGIAGSTSAEVEGIFIAQSLSQAFYFAGFGVHERVDGGRLMRVAYGCSKTGEATSSIPARSDRNVCDSQKPISIPSRPQHAWTRQKAD
jgi:hypothetical protein